MRRLLLIAAFCLPLHADTSSLAARLEQQFKGKALVLNHWSTAKKQTYSPEGALTGGREDGFFVSEAIAFIDEVQVRSDFIEFRALRAVVLWRSPTSKEHPIITKTPDAFQMRVRLHNGATDEDALASVQHVFATPQELLPRLPIYYQLHYKQLLSGDWSKSEEQYCSGPEYINGIKQNATCDLQNEIMARQLGIPRLYNAAGGVTPPRPRQNPEPDYDEDAKERRIEGVVTLQTVIGADGRLTNIEVVGGLTHGLEKNAVKAVQRWKFQPATLNGSPVPVLAAIEVNFHLF